MANKDFDFKSGDQLSVQSIMIWRIVQSIVWLAGLSILFCLLFFPSTGILLFWDMLIPVAPLLLVLAAGVWRNICPLATTNLLPHHLRLSKGKKLTAGQSGILNGISLIALYTIVPLRHAVFNKNGPATAALIMMMAALGFGLGFIYEWKSVWCSGLCPIHPVEKLYGGNVIMPVPNLHCPACENCVIPCPDSTPNFQPAAYRKNRYQKIFAIGITGGLPGFIWGWFHVPDAAGISDFSSLPEVYKMPWTGLCMTLLIYLVLSRILPSRFEKKLNSLFAASAVSCYYWYRIPSLFGFGIYAKDGLLLDLKTTVPGWTVYLVTTGFMLFFFYWLVIRKANRTSWLIRPRYAARRKNSSLTMQERA